MRKFAFSLKNGDWYAFLNSYYAQCFSESKNHPITKMRIFCLLTRHTVFAEIPWQSKLMRRVTINLGVLSLRYMGESFFSKNLWDKKVLAKKYLFETQICYSNLNLNNFSASYISEFCQKCDKFEFWSRCKIRCSTVLSSLSKVLLFTNVKIYAYTLQYN